MSAEFTTETSHLIGPEYSTEAPCPTCGETVLVDGIMFVADGEEGEVHETCHWCEQPYVVRRRTHFVGYTLISHATRALVPPGGAPPNSTGDTGGGRGSLG